ncbi:CRAL-TRIO domain-containing protein YKL091C-like [Impatiens glandulifera]|uniref:CRAL-TRIO domain-containing protein YKL091C-like n=1 Tax=Impatiens glandulifera TaxID=253017 RepID=UPI001FB16932|nr:CRAL-TRIO domain-containing protein YKL091C-like [Impatiens glandulifera]
MDRIRNGETVITQMRKLVQNLGSSTEKYEEATLMRFLIARSMDPNKAAKMFVEWRKWRTAIVPGGFVNESEVSDELGARKIYLQSQMSKDGYPVLIIKVNKHFPSKDQPQLKKFVIHALDKAIASSVKEREIGNEKLIAIFDLQHITYKNVDARALITSFQFLQAYYPERLAKCYFLHMPSFFVSIWKMVSYFIEKATLDKVVIISNEDAMKEFVREVGEDTLPKEYGGQAELIAIQDVVVTQLHN